MKDVPRSVAYFLGKNPKTPAFEVGDFTGNSSLYLQFGN